MRDAISAEKSSLFYLVLEQKTAHSHEYWQDVPVVWLLDWRIRVNVCLFWTDPPSVLRIEYYTSLMELIFNPLHLSYYTINQELKRKKNSYFRLRFTQKACYDVTSSNHTTQKWHKAKKIYVNYPKLFFPLFFCLLRVYPLLFKILVNSRKFYYSTLLHNDNSA